MMKLLLIEDNPDDVAAVRRMTSARVQVTVASDGREALQRMSRVDGRPDLVLLDLHLPGMPGLEVLQRMKGDAELRDVPVIVLSGSWRDEDIKQGMLLGAHSHVVKPIGGADVDWILASVNNVQPRLLALRALEGGL
jgi:CheY-like chemotaxis protein